MSRGKAEKSSHDREHLDKLCCIYSSPQGRRKNKERSCICEAAIYMNLLFLSENPYSLTSVILPSSPLFLPSRNTYLFQGLQFWRKEFLFISVIRRALLRYILQPPTHFTRTRHSKWQKVKKPKPEEPASIVIRAPSLDTPSNNSIMHNSSADPPCYQYIEDTLKNTSTIKELFHSIQVDTVESVYIFLHTYVFVCSTSCSKPKEISYRISNCIPPCPFPYFYGWSKLVSSKRYCLNLVTLQHFICFQKLFLDFYKPKNILQYEVFQFGIVPILANMRQ